MRDDNIVIFIGIVAILLLGLGVFALHQDSEHRKRYNAWVSDCINAGGIVAPTGVGRDECFIKNKIEKLPGWERY